jgi:hypothetical protein
MAAGNDQIGFFKDIAIILAGVVALVTFFFGVLEYVRQGRQHNAANFVQMRRRFLETSLFREILDLLAHDDPLLKEISVQDRRNFVGFLEEVALMANSKIISPEVAYYMFGYYVVLTDRSENIWEDLDRSGAYWAVFRHFASQMKAFEPDEAQVLSLKF